MPDRGADAPPPQWLVRARGALKAGRRRLPPARLLWIILLGLGANGVLFLGGTLGVASLAALPPVAVALDLAFQKLRFDRLRFPDAAIATGLFLALLFPPEVPLVAASIATLGAVGLRHVLRARGRPWFNPAATGLVLGAVAFGLAPAWWGAVNETWVVLGGAVLFLWNLPRWRLPVAFLGGFAGFTTLGRIVYTVGSGSIVSLHVLELSIADPTLLFFGLLMVAEPRTGPRSPRMGWLYGVAIAASAAFLPLALPTLALPVALLVGNTFVLVMRLRPALKPVTADERSPLGRRRTASTEGSSLGGRWSAPRRIAAGIGVGIVMLLLASTLPPSVAGPPLLSSNPGGTGVGGGGGGSVARCQHDAAGIDAPTLSSLHKTLGPSVILSYTRATGIVVFYDPVNLVTVTETDLYEDFGYAEFNSDDGTVPGCAA